MEHDLGRIGCAPRTWNDMSWPNGQVSSRKARKRLVGLTIRGESEPEVYRVSEDVFHIIEKMLRLNQAVGPYVGHPRFDFEEVRFLLKLLGASPLETLERISSTVELWIAE